MQDTTQGTMWETQDTAQGAREASENAGEDACEETAYRDGLAAGLAAALDGLGPPAPPGRIAALPADRVPPGADLVRSRLAERAGIAFVRSDAAVPGPGPLPAAPERAELAARLGAARFGITRRLAERAAAYLSARESGGEPLIRRQLVQGDLADLHVGVEVLRDHLRAARGRPAALAYAHERLTALDWEAVKLLGASGYVAEGEGGADLAHVSRLIANCWIPKDARA
jgi:hypothetical protein